MPIPRLQIIGGEEDRFIYDLAWKGEPRRGDVRSGRLDTTLRFAPGVGDKLVRLSGLLRPLIQNLVLAHRRCNQAKRDFLAATDHVERWDRRLAKQGHDLQDIAARARWASEPSRLRNVARAMYLRLRESARLWMAGNSFVPPDLPRLKQILTSWPRGAPTWLKSAEPEPPTGYGPTGYG